MASPCCWRAWAISPGRDGSAMLVKIVQYSVVVDPQRQRDRDRPGRRRRRRRRRGSAVPGLRGSSAAGWHARRQAGPWQAALKYVPHLPMLTEAPCGSSDQDMLQLPTLSRTHGARLNDFLNRMPTPLPLKLAYLVQRHAAVVWNARLGLGRSSSAGVLPTSPVSSGNVRDGSTALPHAM